jgi:hypothetical protein
VTPIEWVMKKSDHSGRTGINKGESCVGCHEEKGGLNFDMKRLAGKDLEPKGAPKTMNFPVTVQSAYDKDNAYVRLTSRHRPAASTPPTRRMKSRWRSCSPTTRSPRAPGRLLGDLPQRRAHDARRRRQEDQVHQGRRLRTDAVEERQGRQGADGSVTDKRNMEGGTAGVKAEGSKSGDTYTVTFTRKLSGALAEGKATPSASPSTPTMPPAASITFRWATPWASVPTATSSPPSSKRP